LAAEQQFHQQMAQHVFFSTGTVVSIIAMAPDSLETYSDRNIISCLHLYINKRSTIILLSHYNNKWMHSKSSTWRGRSHVNRTNRGAASWSGRSSV